MESEQSTLKKGSSSANNGKKSVKKANYSKQIMDHVSDTNYFRKHLPNIFTGESTADQSSILQEKLKTLAPVPLPNKIMKSNEHKITIEKFKQLSPLRNVRSTRNLDMNTVQERPNRTLDGIKRGS